MVMQICNPAVGKKNKDFQLATEWQGRCVFKKRERQSVRDIKDEINNLKCCNALGFPRNDEWIFK